MTNEGRKKIIASNYVQNKNLEVILNSNME